MATRDSYDVGDFNEVWDKENLTDQWWLTRTPYPVACFVTVYLLIIFKYGRSFMEHREPYKLKTAMRIYNLLQVMMNVGIWLQMFSDLGIVHCITSLTCTTHVPEFESCGKKYSYTFIANFWFYLVLKMIDLSDTVFMVLRKKYSHISFLHVYHHLAMVCFTWITLVYIKNQQGIIPGLINTFVHAVMYSYYFLATFSRFKPTLSPWKKYITKIQLGQFVVILFYIIYLYTSGCQMSRIFTLVWAFNVFVILLLFVNFYIKSYILPKREIKQD